MSIIKRCAALALVMAATLAASVGLSSPALAASSPIEACGGGSYHVIDSHAYGSSAITYLARGNHLAPKLCRVRTQKQADPIWPA